MCGYKILKGAKYSFCNTSTCIETRRPLKTHLVAAAEAREGLRFIPAFREYVRLFETCLLFRLVWGDGGPSRAPAVSFSIEKSRGAKAVFRMKSINVVYSLFAASEEGSFIYFFTRGKLSQQQLEALLLLRYFLVTLFYFSPLLFQSRYT